MSLKQLFTTMCIMLFALSISAEVPNTMNYQGLLTDAAGDPVVDGGYLVKFIIYDAPTAGTDLWNTGFQTINTIDGLFSYQLGSMVALPNGIFSDTSRYLGLTVGVDPELSPRSRFITTAYSFNAQNADLASDADSLGGLQPSHYLDWNNTTNIPADIADGDDVDTDWNNLINVPADIADGDDEGLSQTTADANYVKKIGDTLTGSLSFQHSSLNRIILDQGNNFSSLGLYSALDILTARIFCSSNGRLELYDDNGIQNIDLGAGTTNGGYLGIFGSEFISFSAEVTGNSTAFLPENAIDNTEILDEPGIASNNNSTTINITTATMIDLVTVQITIPTSGYIYLTGRTWSRHTGSTGNTNALFQIDETAGGSITGNYWTAAGASTAVNSNLMLLNAVSVDRIYFKSAGTYTFRLEGRLDSSVGPPVVARNNWLTAMFFPTSYGSVSTISPLPPADADAELVSTEDMNGNISQAYKYDLRDLELKAKATALKAKEAELELMKARHQQNSNQD